MRKLVITIFIVFISFWIIYGGSLIFYMSKEKNYIKMATQAIKMQIQCLEANDFEGFKVWQKDQAEKEVIAADAAKKKERLLNLFK